MKVKTRQSKRRPAAKRSTAPKEQYPTKVMVMNSINPNKYFAVRTDNGGFVSISVQNKGDVEISATRLHSDERIVFRSNSATPARVTRAMFKAFYFALATEKPKVAAKQAAPAKQTDHRPERFHTSDVLQALKAKPTSPGWLLRRLHGKGPQDFKQLASLLDRVKQAGYVRQRGGKWALTPNGASRLS